jgi:hypothetical protein
VGEFSGYHQVFLYVRSGYHLFSFNEVGAVVPIYSYVLNRNSRLTILSGLLAA